MNLSPEVRARSYMRHHRCHSFPNPASLAGSSTYQPEHPPLLLLFGSSTALWQEHRVLCSTSLINRPLRQGCRGRETFAPVSDWSNSQRGGEVHALAVDWIAGWESGGRERKAPVVPCVQTSTNLRTKDHAHLHLEHLGYCYGSNLLASLTPDVLALSFSQVTACSEPGSLSSLELDLAMVTEAENKTPITSKSHTCTAVAHWKI